MLLDWYPKAFWESFPQELLESCPEGLTNSEIFDFHFNQKLNNEFISMNGEKFVADCPFDTVEKLVIGLEFQSYEINYDKEITFNEYQANLHKENKKHVLMVVFSSVHDKHDLIKHKTGMSDELTILIISLTALNKEQTINNSLYIINNNYDMPNKEKALFFISPLMVDEKDIVEVINVLMANFYKISNCTENEKIKNLNIVMLYANQYVFVEAEDENGGNDMVALSPEAQELMDRFINKGIDQGIEQGKDKWIGIAISAVDMVKGGSSLEEASAATGLSLTQVDQLCGSK